MGTRAITKIYNEDNQEIVNIYSQYDGGDYLFEKLKVFIAETPIVNGFSGDDQKVANGMGCFAAQLIKSLKVGVGGFYLYPPKTKDVGEEYVYKIKAPRNGVGFAEINQKVIK
jgi:hypothetical protein